MRLTSPAFEDTGTIPNKYGYDEQNINPPLEIEGVPATAQSLVLIVDDPDAVEPAGKIWDHWITWNIPAATKKIPEDESPGIDGENDYGEQGYGGPNPPDGEHTYVFRLYALDADLDLSAGSSRDELEEQLKMHLIDKATLRGTYAP